MPNIQTKSLDTISMPFEADGYRFDFEAISKHDKLIHVEHEGKEFFLQVIKREDDYLIKADKITRPSQVKILQNALKAFVEFGDIETTFSNINSSKNRHSKKSPYLKNIEYFFKEFDSDKQIMVEVGFGSGRHLLHQALSNPDMLVIGIEIHKPSIEQVLKQIEIKKIENILLLDYDARIFLEFLPSNRVDKIFVHFPVPWDKKPHRRVISKMFTEEVGRVLERGGTLELRTDSNNYFEYSLSLFMNLSSAHVDIKKNRDLHISSKYEDRWKKLKKDIYDLTYINDSLSQEKQMPFELGFEDMADFSMVKPRFENKTIRGENCFVHFENLYEIDDKNGFVKLSLGANGKGEHRYLFFRDGKVFYFPNSLLPSNENIDAHKIIKEWIWTA